MEASHFPFRFELNLSDTLPVLTKYDYIKEVEEEDEEDDNTDNGEDEEDSNQEGGGLQGGGR